MEQKDNTTESNDAFSSMLGGILSNPEMMSAISSMAKKLKADQEESKDEMESTALIESPKAIAEEKPISPPSPSSDDLSGAVSALAPLLSGINLKDIGGDDDKACLLRALKPYLCKSRCDAIDHIITVSRLSHLFKKIDRR